MVNESEVIKFLSKFGAQSLIAPLKEKNKSETEIPKPTRTLKPENVVKNFGKMNDPGDYAIYFLVNQSKSPTTRKIEDINNCRAIWIEDDVTGSKRPVSDFPIPPNIIVNSSPGKYHYYWLTSTSDKDQHQLVMQRLVDEYNCDPNARDLSRVMRIPGFYHLKGDPFMVTAEYLVEAPYSWDTIIDAFPPAERVVKINQSSDGKFDKSSAEEKIATGENYHETLRDLALSFANKRLDREDIADLLRMKMMNVPKQNRDERWHDRVSDGHIYECVDSALRILANEETPDLKTATIDNFSAPITRVPTLPLEILVPDNAFGDIVRAIHDSWWRPNWMASHLAAKSLVAYLAGGKYKGSETSRMNIQQVGVGRTGCGKDPITSAPTKIISAIFSTGPYAKIGSKIVQDVASAEGMEDLIRTGDKHDILFCADEIGGFIEQAKRPGPKQNILNYFLTMYSKSDEAISTRIRSKAQSQQQDPGGQIIHDMLYAPHVIVSGATTPNLVVEGLGMSFIQRGSASRMLFFDCDSYLEDTLRSVKTLDEDLIGERACKQLLTLIESDPVSGSPLYSMPSARAHKPITIQFDDNAIDAAFDFNSCSDEKIGKGGGITEIWNRARANASKHAMIEAVLINPHKPVVTVDIMLRAIEFVKSGCEYTVKLFADEVGENESDIAVQKIKSKLKEHKGEKVLMSELCNMHHMRKLRASERKQILQELEDASVIERIQVKNTRGKPTIFYTLVEQPQQ